MIEKLERIDGDGWFFVTRSDSIDEEERAGKPLTERERASGRLAERLAAMMPMGLA